MEVDECPTPRHIRFAAPYGNGADQMRVWSKFHADKPDALHPKPIIKRGACRSSAAPLPPDRAAQPEARSAR